MSSAMHNQSNENQIPAAIAASGRGGALLHWLFTALPTALVIAVLGGVAAWGHFSEWQLPKFSTLIGNVPPAEDVWCQAHNVLESECIECDAKLLPLAPDHGWCKEHGVAQCLFEHPEMAQLKTPLVITSEMRERASRALTVKPRAENSSLCKLYLKRVQFASAAAIEKAGVDIAVVQQRPVVEAATAPGEIQYDQTRMAHLSSRVAGTVWQVYGQVGDRVRAGDCLALVDAADVGKAKAELLQAIAQVRLKQIQFDRLKSLGEAAIAARQLREAETLLEEAKIRQQSAVQSLINLGLPVRLDELAKLDLPAIAARLHFLGLPSEVAASLDLAATTSNLFPIRAPLDGLIIDRHVVVGEVVDSSAVLMTVANTTQMWLILNVREEDARYVSLGQPVLFRPHSGEGEPEIRGSVAWISTSADEQTRTVKVRAVLPDTAGGLRANTFGSGRIVLREEPQAVVAPSEAVHWDGSCHVVFVRDKNFHEEESPKFFHVRTVRPGVKEGDRTEIIAGLAPGEVIASKNSGVLSAQLLKSNLGAGCGCVDGH